MFENALTGPTTIVGCKNRQRQKLPALRACRKRILKGSALGTRDPVGRSAASALGQRSRFG